ncbi:MAG: nucleotidyltransferase domain-containing protein [Dongiaceae bacterium]
MKHAGDNRGIQHGSVRENCGQFGSAETALEAVVVRLVKHLDPKAIYLFGSRAGGNARPDSDFDLLVVTRSEDGAAGYDYDRAYAPLVGFGIGCDVVPCPEQDFDSEKDRPTSLCYTAYHHGRKVYERRR